MNMDWMEAALAWLATGISLSVAVSVIAVFWFAIYKGFFRSFQFIREFFEPEEAFPAATSSIYAGQQRSLKRRVRKD